MKRLKDVLQKMGLDAAIFCNLSADGYDRNLFYLSGYKGIGCLVVPVVGRPILFVPSMEYERVKSFSGIRIIVWEKGKRLFDAVNDELKSKKNAVKNIGIVYSDFRLDGFRSLKKFVKKVTFKDIGAQCLELRRIKTDSEIIKIRKSCSIAVSIFKKCINELGKFRTEIDIETFLHSETVKAGCELSFPPVVGSGKNGSAAHHEADARPLRKGFCVIDFGVKYDGYHSDITRTVYFGKPAPDEVKVYDLVRKVQEQLIKEVKLGLECGKLYDNCNKLLGEYADNFNHGLGHGIGLQIHELPNLKGESLEIFANNMVFTIEPGVYFANKYGIRIEDDVLLQNGKCKVLTKLTKDLIIIGE